MDNTLLQSIHALYGITHHHKHSMRYNAQHTTTTNNPMHSHFQFITQFQDGIAEAKERFIGSQKGSLHETEQGDIRNPSWQRWAQRRTERLGEPIPWHVRR